MSAWLEEIWYRPQEPPTWLRRLAAVYGAAASRLARQRKAGAQRVAVPVIVVGNIAVGGTGKTPFVIWLVEELSERGLRPGIVSRGYGGHAPTYPMRVTADTDPAQSGDEPALLARRLGVPIAVAPDRVAAARLLIDSGEVDIIVADDGLQHQRLARDLEICVVDGLRGFGNGALLPAGPLRETPERLTTVDLIVVNGGGWRPRPLVAAPVVDMSIQAGAAVALVGGARQPLAEFRGARVHAVAGIGNPRRFFAALQSCGMEVVPHEFPDHHPFTARDLRFDDDAPVLMTEKDMVKCAAFARAGYWYVPTSAHLDRSDAELVQQLLDRLNLPSRLVANG